jgi:NhaP-type Na+/H+ or K+/H+ antiporter
LLFLFFLLDTFGHSVSQWVQIDAELLLYIFLPPLVFGEAMFLNWYHLKGGFIQSVILAVPGVLISAALLGVIAKAILPYHWGWNLAMIFGTILAPTDTVAVVSLLKSVGASPKLTMLVVGESLLNDGTALVLFSIFFNALNGTHYTALDIFAITLASAIGSVLLGIFCGLLTVRWMRSANRPLKETDVTMQIAMTICCAYLTFFVAQYSLEISGPVACCSAGAMIAWLGPPIILNHESMHNIWGMLEWGLNTMIFLIAGLIIGHRVLESVSRYDWLYMFLFYLLILAIRSITILLLYPFISSIGHQCTRMEAIFMSWSGLRGALSMALALIVENGGPESIDEDTKRLFFYVGGVAALSLIINGTTSKGLLYQLGLLTTDSAEKQMVTNQIKKKLRKKMDSIIIQMTKEFSFTEEDLEEVRMSCTLLNDFSMDHLYRDTLIDNQLQQQGLFGEDGRQENPEFMSSVLADAVAVRSELRRNIHNLDDDEDDEEGEGEGATGKKRKDKKSHLINDDHNASSSNTMNISINEEDAISVNSQHQPAAASASAATATATTSDQKKPTSKSSYKPVSIDIEKLPGGFTSPVSANNSSLTSSRYHSTKKGKAPRSVSSASYGGESYRFQSIDLAGEDDDYEAGDNDYSVLDDDDDTEDEEGGRGGGGGKGRNTLDEQSLANTLANSKTSLLNHRKKQRQGSSLLTPQSYQHRFLSGDGGGSGGGSGGGYGLDGSRVSRVFSGATSTIFNPAAIANHSNSMKLQRISRLLSSSYLHTSSSPHSPHGHSYHRGTYIFNSELLIYIRSLFLEIVRVKYWHFIEIGKLPRQSFSAQFLLYSIEVALDEIMNNPTTIAAPDDRQGIYSKDFLCLSKEIYQKTPIIDLLRFFEENSHFPFCCRIIRDSAVTPFLSFLETRKEKREVYMLTSFIEAHEHAQAKIHKFLGLDLEEMIVGSGYGGSTQGGGGGDGGGGSGRSHSRSHITHSLLRDKAKKEERREDEGTPVHGQVAEDEEDHHSFPQSPEEIKVIEESKRAVMLFLVYSALSTFLIVFFHVLFSRLKKQEKS